MNNSRIGNLSALLLAVLLTFVIPTSSFAETINYQYDALNRVIRTENATNGSVVEYQYDAVGNRTQRQVIPPPNIVTLRVTVRRDAQTALAGIHTYLFNESSAYTGKAQVTGENGVAQFDVARGSYKVRADYLGYQYWTDAVLVNSAASTELTIPHQTVNIAVNNVFQGSATPLAGINVYLFTPTNSYLGLHLTTASDGRVSFLLPTKDYKVRADYLGQQYFSDTFNAQDTAVNIPMAEAEVTVIQGGQPVSGVHVYAFSPAGAYLSITHDTATSGKAVFRLPAAAYTFRADYLGNQYWSASQALVADQSTPVLINTGGGNFTLTVLKGGEPLAGVNCYLFNTAGSYLGLSRTLDNSGRASFSLANGTYKFRIDYLGYQFWTDGVTIPETMSLSHVISHGTATITVMGSQAGEGQYKANVPVYLFTPSGSYLGVKVNTDAAGQATFNLPQQAYKMRADYLSRQYWSEMLTWEPKTILIPEGTARIYVTMADTSIAGVSVYAFNASGSYLGIHGTSDASGLVDFLLPAGSYKFRADYQGSQHWAGAEINQGVINAVELSTGGGLFTLTLDKGTGPLSGVRVYLFSVSGSYLGTYGNSDSNGQATFNLANGSYKFRADYLGYQFWSDPFTVPGVLSGVLSIPHQDTTVTVEGSYPNSQALSGINVYLFTTAGSYLGKMQTTNSYGQVLFNLPNKSYKVRADYLGYQFWSDPFQYQNVTISILRGLVRITAYKAGNPISGIPVYLFSASGSYLGMRATTDTEGKVDFLLPERAFKFRLDEGGTQHWSPVTTIVGGQINPIEMRWD